MRTIRELTLRMAKDNPGWGYTRIVGALTNVGHNVARTTVAKIQKAAGIAPAPERPTSWRTFLKAHASTIAAADFFSVEVWTARGSGSHPEHGFELPAASWASAGSSPQHVVNM
jgi:hypothetical protein